MWLNFNNSIYSLCLIIWTCMHFAAWILTYMHAHGGTLIYLYNKHLFGAFYHVCVHVIYLETCKIMD